MYKNGIFLFRQISKPQTSQRVRKYDNLYSVLLLYFTINIIFTPSFHITRKSDFEDELFLLHYFSSNRQARKP
jgi:hypothetical protein